MPQLAGRKVSPTVVLLGVPPKPPGVHANSSISRKDCQELEASENESLSSAKAGSQIEMLGRCVHGEARPAPDHSHRRGNYSLLHFSWSAAGRAGKRTRHPG